MTTPNSTKPQTTAESLPENAGDVRFPLTREQEGLWIEWKLSPLGVSYNTCIQMQLLGSLDVQRFVNAVADVVAQFQLLQAYCIEVDSQPFFKLSNDRYEVEAIDMSEGKAVETKALKSKALALLTRRRDAAIDLTQFPLIRSAIITTAIDTHYFVGVVPHIISDGYSAVFVLKAISIAYKEGKAGLVAAFGDAPDWQDYIVRRGGQSAQSAELAVAHWQTVLADAEHMTPICQNLPDESGHAFNIDGKRHFFCLEADKVVRFARMARGQKTSLFSILAALYAVFLYRQTGQEDLVVVFPVNMRPAGYRDAFGFYVNMVPLRIDLSGNPSFLEIVNQIGRRRRADKKHQHLPGLDIVRAKREASPGFDGRLCNVSMAQTVSRFEGLEIPGVVSTALDNDHIHVRDDLSLMYEVSEERIGLWLEYRESSFDDDEIRSMADRILHIAEAADENPELPINEIELVSTEDARHILALGCGADLSIVDDNYATMFTSSVESHPNVVALRFSDQQFTYAELELWSRQLANTFAQRPGLVAILLPRCPGQIASLLGALRAGVAYVPLDPEQGSARIEKILKRINPSYVVCDATTNNLVSRTWLSRCISAEPSGATTPVASSVRAEMPAYVIFTSGSTGQPKGVEVSHLALVARISWLMREFPLAAAESVLQNTSYAFDVSVAEILWPLAAGATLILSEPKAAKDPRYLANLIAENGITSVCIVPSAWQILLEAAPDESLLSLQRVLCAGEVLTLVLARQTFRQTQARLFNVYGPTEATIYASWKEILPQDTSITIGRSVAGGQLVVVNSAGKLQPLGIEGELCLAGVGLATGYVDDTALTMEKFPAKILGGQRGYLTGDRVRMLVNGEVEYLGRADAQIKLRGYRIELGEVEHALRQQDGIHDAAVLLVEKTGHKQLRAFVQPSEGVDATITPPDHPLCEKLWRSTLRQLLPSYMLPNTLSWVAAIPRLASGKLDRAALSGAEHRPNLQGKVPPKTDDERAMVKIWANVLGLPRDRIDLHSNFFELGGDSLMLIAVATQAEAAGLYIDVHELFEHATIAEALPLARSVPRSFINQAPIVGNFALLPRHHKFFADNFEHPAHWNRTFVLKFNRHIDDVALTQSLHAALRHHDGLRLSFHRADNGYYFTNHAFDAELAQVTTHDLTAVDPQQRLDWMNAQLNEANASLDLARPPLLRVMLFDDESSSTLGLVIHHLLIDMRSCYILLDDLLVGYQATIAHREIRLPAKTTSLAEWSERLGRRVDSQWHKHEVAYWQEQLRFVGHTLPKNAYTAGRSTDGCQATLETTLSEEHTERLTRGLVQELDIGVPGLLLATFGVVFRKWCGASYLVVNTCGVGRETSIEGVNLTRTVGELNSVFPLAIALDTQDTMTVAREAYEHLPASGSHYGALRYIACHQELDQQEPDIFFNYVSRVDTSLQTGLGVSVEMAPRGVASSHPENHSCYALYLEALVQEGCLHLYMGFNSMQIPNDEAAQALDAWKLNLIGLIEARSRSF